MQRLAAYFYSFDVQQTAVYLQIRRKQVNSG